MHCIALSRITHTISLCCAWTQHSIVRTLHCTVLSRLARWCHWCGVTGVHITGVVWVVCNCRYLIVTTGNAGGSCYDDWGPRPGPPGFRDCEKEELTFTRRREMVAAAEYVGIPRSQVSGDSQVL
jgi:hypothetical protein